MLVFLVVCNGKLLQTSLNVIPESREVQAGDSITFRMQATYVAGHPATLVDNRVIHGFKNYKVESNYIIDPLSEGMVTPPVFDNMFSCIT